MGTFVIELVFAFCFIKFKHSEFIVARCMRFVERSFGSGSIGVQEGTGLMIAAVGRVVVDIRVDTFKLAGSLEAALGQKSRKGQYFVFFGKL